MANLKEIHIGSLINQHIIDCEIGIQRICKFFKCTEAEIENMYKQKSLDSEIILKWSKLLKYDFFRLYSQHLMIYAPQGNVRYNDVSRLKKSSLPQFRKNIYTKEIIDFIMEQIETKSKTISEVISIYGIPKTTVYKWINKYKNL